MAVEGYLRESFSPEQVTGLMHRRSEATVSPERIHQHVYSDYDHGGTALPSLAPTPKEATMSTRSQRSPWNHSEPRKHRRPLRECGLEALITKIGEAISS